jgi:hypothetical protein
LNGNCIISFEALTWNLKNDDRKNKTPRIGGFANPHTLGVLELIEFGDSSTVFYLTALFFNPLTQNKIMMNYSIAMIN